METFLYKIIKILREAKSVYMKYDKNTVMFILLHG